MLLKIVFSVLFAQKLMMTPINEDKERHFQKSLKSGFSYDTKIDLGAQSITVNRESLNTKPRYKRERSSHFRQHLN